MTPSQPNKKSGCFPFLLITLLAFGGGYYFGKKLLLGEKLTLQASNKIVPQSALVNTFISTDEKKWSQLREFGTTEFQELTNNNWQEFISENVTINSQNIDYQQDISPWLAGISIALLPSPEAGIDYDTVAILGIKNKLKAKNFFDGIKTTNSGNINETKHQNITIYQLDDQSEKIFFTTFQNYIIIADKQEVITKIIDTHKGGLSLADNSSQKFDKNSELIQVYFPDYSNWFLNIIKNSVPDIEVEKSAKNQLEKIDSILANVSVENHGLKMRSVINLVDPLTTTQQSKPVSNNLLSQIPDNTICVMTGGGINQFWQQVNEETQNIPDLDLLINQAKMMTSQWLNLDLETDIISWLDGEFALALLPPNNNNSLNTLAGLFILESSNKTQGEATLKSLENTAKLVPFLNIQTSDINGINVTKWNSPEANLVSYGWLNDKKFLMSLTGNFEDINNIKPANSLLENSTFKLATASLPNNNNGYFYCNLQEALSVAVNYDPNFWDSSSMEAKALADSISAIALTSSMINPTTSQVDFNISLFKK
ncbi:DUF3352 domain-containing protein [Geminocystis herdmanii]|uniref:DUF3352 domain-containing protein n=1 Tax=Geminocystis herdmanii TaxID=669359 RepID=UPI00034DDEDD|nr:DUF3352 domain-containing protein [Geminocystis herdmanii]